MILSRSAASIASELSSGTISDGRDTAQGIAVLLVALLSLGSAHAGTPPDSTLTRALVHAVRTSETITVDGVLSERIWSVAPAWDRFVQRDPVEGAPATERTEVRLVYDDVAIYVGARMHDSAPDSIVARLGRKDTYTSSDYFVIYLDSYYDHRSGFMFALDAAGTYFDGVVYNDEWTDETWDGVWDGRVAHDSLGWTAEMRIPFSQLRFRSTETWGVNFERDVARKHENTYLAFTPKDGSGFASRFADLKGIDQIRPPARIEVLPYARAKAEYGPSVAGDPFNDGSSYTPGAGLDLKVGIGTNLTLDATVNPDFGQVEVDPAVVNLSDVETFFSEKRPFFVEGASIFDNFGRGGGRSYWGFNWYSPNLFYSRRIGRTPQGSVPEAEYADVPEGTRIIGAGKLTGRLGDGWTVGTIQALTAREYAEVQTDGERSRAEIEPLTYYGVFRGLREFSAGGQGLGFLATAAARLFRDDRLRDELSRDAVTGGIDGWFFLDADREWVVSGSVMGSHVRGSPERILDLQTSSQRYYQRPDAGHVSIDSAATSLSGYAARAWLNKQKGNVIFNSAVGILSPGFEINDLGYLSRTDILNAHIGGGYKWVIPTAFYRTLSLIGALFQSRDFGGSITWQGVFATMESELPNYMELDIMAAYNPQTLNNRRTRGGPLTLDPPGYQVDVELSTDHRQDILLNLAGGTYQSSWSRAVVAEASLEWRPTSTVILRLGPSLELNREYSQWVDVFDDPTAGHTYGRRYVFGTMNQKTIAANIRLNWTFTPRLSLQFYLQPLISTGDYEEFKELAAPRTYDFRRYGTDSSTIVYDDGTYTVDPDGPGPARPFSFSDPDYHYMSLRGNAVLRWEFTAGSTLYLVWTQTRNDEDQRADFHFGPSFRQLMKAAPENIFMIKFSYWWSI